MKQLLGKNYIMKLIWIFIVGSLMGYVIETGYYFIKHGVFLSKQGLLYGHFKPIYGFGSVLITMLLSAFVNQSYKKVFAYGCLLGGAFEYFCSLVLEYMFHTSMWHYRSKYLAINGRVNLLYLPIWGLLAILLLRFIIPKFTNIFDKLPEKVMKVITVIFMVFLVFDFSISIVAVQRMKERQNGEAASNKFEKYLDRHYSDEFITSRIPYLKVID